MKGQGPIDSTNSTTFGDLIISTVVEEALRQSSPRGRSPGALRSGLLTTPFRLGAQFPGSLSLLCDRRGIRARRRGSGLFTPRSDSPLSASRRSKSRYAIACCKPLCAAACSRPPQARACGGWEGGGGFSVKPLSECRHTIGRGWSGCCAIVRDLRCPLNLLIGSPDPLHDIALEPPIELGASVFYGRGTFHRTDLL
jgi:hypothetical protein